MELIGVRKTWIGDENDTKPAVNVWPGDRFLEIHSVTSARTWYVYAGSVLGWTVEKVLSDICPSEGTPVNAVNACGEIVFSGLPNVHVSNVTASGFIQVVDAPVAESTFIVDTETFTFKAASASTLQVTIGASPATTAINMKTQINLALATVVASSAATIVTIKSASAGTLGNLIPISSATLALVASGAFLTGGVDHVHESVTIAAQEFIFMTTRTGIGQVTVGASVATMCINMAAAVTADMTTITATATATTVDLVAATAGTVGNAILLVESASNTTISHAHLEGGIDGTVGRANELRADASYLYHAIAANTTADKNWRRITLGTAY